MNKLLRLPIALGLLLVQLAPGRVQGAGELVPAGINVLYSDFDGLVLEMNTPDYQIQHAANGTAEFDQLSVPGAGSNAEPGKPQLPTLTALIGAPPGAEIHLEILADRSMRLPGKLSLAPALSPARPDSDFEPGRMISFADRGAYAVDSFTPDSPVRIEEEGWVRDQRIVRIVFYPFQYNPAQGSLRWHRQLKVKVTFSGEQALSITDKNDGVSPFESILKTNLINYEAAKGWRTLENGPLGRPSSNTNLQSAGFKIVVDQDGLYRIPYDALDDAGMDVDNVDPRNFRMTCQGQEVGLSIQGQNDGSFDPGDTVTFYGQYFRGDRMAALYADEDRHWGNQFVYQSDNSLITWDAQLNATMFEKYTGENVYWLSVEESPVPRMPETDGTPGSAETPTYYWETLHREESHVWWSWHFTSEDTWLWERIAPSIGTPTITKTYTATLTALATEEISATVRGEVVAFSFNNSASPDHHTQVYINNQTSSIDDDTWDGHVRYTFEGQTSQASLVEGENQLQFVAHKTENMTVDYLYFDWFEIEYARKFEASGNQLLFSNDQAGTYQYQSHGFTNGDMEIYDITSPITPTRVLSPVLTTNGSGAYSVTFETTHDANARYFVAAVGDSAVIQSPVSITAYTPQDFGSFPGVDYVLITHRDFMTATQTLADYRAAQGISSLVVDVAELYDQFNYGIYNPIAIKNFLVYTFQNWNPIPAYAVLIGGGNWDLHGFREDSGNYPIYMPPNLAFVDPWQGEVDSANLLANVIGDEDDILPDLAIGRIPVESVAELNHVIEKIIAFESSSLEDWQQNILFVADNVPDSAGDFVASSEDVINNHIPPSYHPLRIYENDFGCTSTNSPECKAVTNAITRTINYTGALFVNFTGHGSMNRWSGEQILRTTDEAGKKDDPYYNPLITLENDQHFPIVLDMTCLTGYWIYPRDDNVSLAVALLTLENAGAVSTFSPTGLGVGYGHDILQRGFYDAIFKDGVRDLGTATIAAKFDIFQSGFHFDLIQTFTIFGDPALRIPVIQSVFLPGMFK